jgi:sporulation protein YlmC with PRC-barrel domain
MPQPLRTAALCAAFAVSGIALALAQTTPPQPPPGQDAAPQAPSLQAQWDGPHGDAIRASRLIGSSVRNAAGETIGDIDEVVISKDGKVAAVVLGVGGFLGLGERHVAVGFESLQLRPDDAGRMTPTLDVGKEALKTAPEWKWSAEDQHGPTGGTKPVR